MHLPHTRTLGPRGDVGVNPRATHKALEPLRLMVDAIAAGHATAYRYRRLAGGHAVMDCPIRPMGGRTRANTRRSNPNKISNVHP